MTLSSDNFQDQINEPTDPPGETLTGAQPAARTVPLRRFFRLPRTFASLRHRNFRLFVSGQFVSLTGTWVQGAALSWLIYELTQSKEQLGLIQGLRTFPVMLLSLYGGVMADRHSRHRIVVVTQTLSMILALMLALLVFQEMVAVWHIILITIAFGAIHAFDIPARHSFVVEMVGEEDLTNAIALNSSVFNAARVIGPALAGIMMVAAGAAACFLINGLSYIAVIVGLVMMRFSRPAEVQEKPEQSSAWKQVTEGFGIVLRHPKVRRLLTLDVVVGMFGASYAVLMPVFASDILLTNESGFGFMLSATGLGALCGALVVANLRNKERAPYYMFAGMLMLCANMMIFAWAHHIGPVAGGVVENIFGARAVSSGILKSIVENADFCVAVVSLAGVGMGLLLLLSTINGAIQSSVSNSVRGRVMGEWSFAYVGSVPMGSLLIGFTAERIGAPEAVTANAVICLTAGLYVILKMLKNRQVETLNRV